MKRVALLLALFLCASAAARSASAAGSVPPVKTLRVTVLSTMLCGNMEKGIGEWGFSALVEVDGHRLLFDTGNRPNTVLQNARELGLDLGDITDVVLSHHHIDHVGGLLALRLALSDQHPAALTHVHVARGAFWSRGAGPYGGDENPLIALRPRYEAAGGTFSEHDAPVELLPGVWFTGPIPRPRAEQPPMRGDQVKTPDHGFVPDTVPDDAALVFDTVKGLVVLTGCGHAGFINTLEYARATVRTAPVYAALGGFHLAHASEDDFARTAEKLRGFGLRYFHGGHCTGLEAVYRLRTLANLPREAAAVAAVGSWFDLDQGIHPLALAR